MPWLPRLLPAIVAALVISYSSPVQADNGRAKALVDEGQALALAGDREQALERYERAIESDIDYIPAYEAALPLWFALGHLQEARVQLESLTLRCDNCVFAWYALGALYRKIGRFDLAALAYEAYLAKRPGDPDGHFGLAMAFAASDDPRAREQLARYLQLETRPERSAYRARALLLLRKLGGTSDTALVAAERFSGDAIPAVASLIEAGRLASAESVLLGSGRTDSQALYWRVKIAEGRGQWFHRLGYGALLRLYLLSPN